MVATENLAQLHRERFEGERSSGYGSLLPSHNGEHNKFYMQTSFRQDFGMSKKPGLEETLSKRHPKLSNHAGGCGGAKKDMGFATSGASGEIVSKDFDPQRNTEAQRAWLYTKDPMFAPPPQPLDPVTHLSLDVKSELPVPKPRVGPVTKSVDPRRFAPGTSVFNDY